MEDSLRRTRIEILLLFVLYLIILPQASMDYDMGFWRQWALYLHHNGLTHAYNGPINYFPVYIYALYIYDLLQGTDAHIIAHINSIKILFIFFDFLPIFVLCGFRQKILSYKVPYLYLLLNVAYVFTSLVWGQIDSIYTNLSFLAIVIGLVYPVPALVLYMLALNTKPQAIEFLPVILIVLAYSIRNLRTLFLTIIITAAIKLLLLAPFLGNGGAHKLLYLAGNSVGLYNHLSICAFNIWYLITSGNPYFINDTNTYFLLSYRTIGMILFGISMLAVMIPLYKQIWERKKENLSVNGKTHEMLFLGTGLLCLFFFYFNAEMHERYAHPIIIFFFFYGAVSKNYRLFILASIPYYLSLDKCFSYPYGYLPIVHYKIIYGSKIIALWYTATVIYGSWLYYKTVKKGSVAVAKR